MVAPDLFFPEVQNAVLKYRRAGALSASQSEDVLAATVALIDGFFSTRHLSTAAWALASELDHSPYDCLYLALARELKTRVLTADERLLRKLRQTRFAGDCLRLDDFLTEGRNS